MLDRIRSCKFFLSSLDSSVLFPEVKSPFLILVNFTTNSMSVEFSFLFTYTEARGMKFSFSAIASDSELTMKTELLLLALPATFVNMTRVHAKEDHISSPET